MATNNAINATNVNHALLIGTGSAYTSLAPSATTGQALVSQGASANPAYGTVSIAGGGTNATSFTQANGIVTYNGTRLVNYAGPQISSAGIQTNTTQPAFSAILQTDTPNVTGDGTSWTIAANAVVVNNGNNYNSSTFTFTAPVDGIYVFGCSVGTSTSLTAQGGLQFVTTSAAFTMSTANYLAMGVGGANLNISVSTQISLHPGDTCYAIFFCGGGAKTVGVLGTPFGNVTTSFWGYLVC